MVRCSRTRNSTRLHVVGRQPQPRRRWSRASTAPLDRVVLAHPLAHVVQQGGQVQRHRPVDAGHLLGRPGERLGVLAPGQRLQHGHRVQRVLVDGVDVIHVVLDAAGDRLPLGHQRRQQPQVVHLLQPRGRGPVAGVGEHGQEAHGADRDRGAAPRRRGRPARLMRSRGAQPDRPIALDGHLEDAEHLRRPPLEHRRLDHLQRPVALDEAANPGRPRRRRCRRCPGPAAGARWAPLGIGAGPRQQARGLAADGPGVALEVVHQRLDRRGHRRADVAGGDGHVPVQPRRHLLLQVEAQLVLAAPRLQVHGDAHLQQPVAGGLERRRLARRHLAQVAQGVRDRRCRSGRTPPSARRTDRARRPARSSGRARAGRWCRRSASGASAARRSGAPPGCPASCPPPGPGRPAGTPPPSRRRRPRSARPAARWPRSGRCRAAPAPRPAIARRARRPAGRPTAGAGSAGPAPGPPRRARARTGRSGPDPNMGRTPAGRSRRWPASPPVRSRWSVRWRRLSSAAASRVTMASMSLVSWWARAMPLTFTLPSARPRAARARASDDLRRDLPGDLDVSAVTGWIRVLPWRSGRHHRPPPTTIACVAAVVINLPERAGSTPDSRALPACAFWRPNLGDPRAFAVGICTDAVV